MTCTHELFSLFQSEVEDTIKRLNLHKGVIGTIVVNTEGMILLLHLNFKLTNSFSLLRNQNS